jgi:hypothetical protein
MGGEDDAMPDYLVTWEIEISADNPVLAAQEALEIQRGTESSAVVFEVADEHGEITRVDLEDCDCEVSLRGAEHDSNCPLAGGRR